MAKKKPRKPKPVCPDPERYEWVNSKEGGYWRKKKWLDTPVRLNAVMAQSAGLTKSTNEAAKQIADRLAEFTEYMVPGRRIARMAGGLKKSCLQNSKMDYTFLQGFEFQEDYPFRRLCRSEIIVKEEKGVLYIRVPVGNFFVKKQSNFVTGYHLHAILLFGDPAKKNALRIETEHSPSYSIGEYRTDCDFSFVLPPKKQPWMVMVGIVCELKGELTPGPTSCRMVVVETGQ